LARLLTVCELPGAVEAELGSAAIRGDGDDRGDESGHDPGEGSAAGRITLGGVAQHRHRNWSDPEPDGHGHQVVDVVGAPGQPVLVDASAEIGRPPGEAGCAGATVSPGELDRAGCGGGDVPGRSSARHGVMVVSVR
jgi:hypothetical protein